MPYAELNAIAGREVAHRNRHILAAACRQAEQDCGCLFGTVRTVGIMRLKPADTPEIGLHTVRHIRRSAKRTIARMAGVNENSLSDAERKRSIGYRSILGAIALVADGNKARTVAAVADPVKPFPPNDILQMFMKP